MNQKRTDPILTDLPLGGSFALLFIEAGDGKRYLRPIGGDWESGINDAVEAMDKAFPGSRMKLFDERYDAWHRVFRPNGVDRPRVLL